MVDVSLQHYLVKQSRLPASTSTSGCISTTIPFLSAYKRLIGMGSIYQALNFGIKANQRWNSLFVVSPLIYTENFSPISDVSLHFLLLLPSPSPSSPSHSSYTSSFPLPSRHGHTLLGLKSPAHPDHLHPKFFLLYL